STSLLDLLLLRDDLVVHFSHRLAVPPERFPIVRRRPCVRAAKALLEEMEVDAAGFHSVVLSAQAEVDHHDPAITDDHVRGRQIAVDDPGPMEATHDPADPPCDLHRRRAAFVEALL